MAGRLIGVDIDELQPMSDMSVGAWIAPRLGPFGGWVGSVVPQGFEAYARILHPVLSPDQQPTTWAAVCAAEGRTPHALMQWNAIAGVVDVTTAEGYVTQTMRWEGGVPEEGNLLAPALPTLLEMLAAHTGATDDCFFALWEGHGQIWPHGDPAIATLRGLEPDLAAANAAILAGPRLRHPARDYLLFSGPLRAAPTMGRRWCPDWSQSPNLCWPGDRSWCVATEIDFDSTLVAGTAGLVGAVLADPALEAWQVDPGDSLAYNGDAVNTGDAPDGTRSE